MSKYVAMGMAVLVMAVAGAQENGLPDGWHLGVQAYTYRKFSFFETLEKSAALGLKSIEMYPGQKIGKDVEGVTGHGMNPEERAAVKARLTQHGVSIAAYGVVNAKDEAGWRAIFEFAREMGIGTVVIEPPQKELATVSKLCDEFQINAAIHNHAKPSTWWDPKAVKAALEGLSERVGACPDIGHWTRSGLNTVEGMKTLEGRVRSIHLKDVKGGEEWVALGMGQAQVAGVLAELRRQGFKGPVSIEHEGDAADPFLPVKQSVRYVELNAMLDIDKLAAGQVHPGDQTADIADISMGLDPRKDPSWPDVPADTKEPPKHGTKNTPKNTPVEPEDPTFKNVVTGQGKASAQADGFPNEGPEMAFDGKQDTKYCVKETSVWLQYQLPEKQEITAYAIRAANDAKERDPKDWRLLGSTDGQQFEVLDERSNETFKDRFQRRTFELKKPGAYSIYRLEITKNAGGSDTTQLSELGLLVKK